MVRNCGLIARGGKVTSTDLGEPKDLFWLPQDGTKPKEVGVDKTIALDEFKKFHQNAVKNLPKVVREIDYEEIKENYN